MVTTRSGVVFLGWVQEKPGSTNRRFAHWALAVPHLGDTCVTPTGDFSETLLTTIGAPCMVTTQSGVVYGQVQ